MCSETRYLNGLGFIPSLAIALEIRNVREACEMKRPLLSLNCGNPFALAHYAMGLGGGNLFQEALEVPLPSIPQGLRP